MGLELSLDDIRRAWDSRDPDLANLIVTLATAPDPRPAQPPREGALSFASFISHLNNYQFRREAPQARARYRIDTMKALEAPAAEVPMPPRLQLHPVIVELWHKNGAYERAVLLEVIRKVPLCWGPWRGLKQVFKEAEEKGDTEVLGALAARFDAAYATKTGSYREISRRTMGYLVRRAWRALRRVGQSLAPAYVDAAVDVLRAYEDSTVFARTWVYNHILHHESKKYTRRNFKRSRAGSNLNERAFAELWRRTPRPVLTLLERAASEQVREFAAAALKTDFRASLREVEAPWVVRLIAVQSATVDAFVIWLLGNVPKFEQGSFRELGLHEPVLRLLDSSSDPARVYAAAYARTHARDLELARLLRLANNSSVEVRKLAADLLGDRDPRKDIGLDAWGQLLGTQHAHDLAASALRKHFSARELTPAWFADRLLDERGKVFEFASELLMKVHSHKSLGASFFRDLLDDPRVSSNAARFALDALSRFPGEDFGREFLARMVLHPHARDTILSWIGEERIKAEDIGAEFWRAVAFHPSWDADPWLRALMASGLPWARDLKFSEDLARSALGFLSDVRRFSPGQLGFDWLMQLALRPEPHYREFALEYMTKALLPADFAPKQAEAPKQEAKGAAKQADLGGKSFLFTGKLATMVRDEAEAKVTGAGGKNSGSVTAKLDYLVIGDEGSPLYGNGRKGSKQVAAEKLVEKGAGIKIISETAFLQMLAGEQREFTADAVGAGCDRLWEMATGPGPADAPQASFARHYIRRHHPDISLAQTDRPVDPGAEIPASYLTWARIKPLLVDLRAPLRQFGLDLARWELARWAPPINEIVEVTEAPYPEVREFFAKALLADESAEHRRYRVNPASLTATAVYGFCESLVSETRALGMQLIHRYPALAIPEELFRLSESPDRQVTSFVVRTIWSLYRDRGITDNWKPQPRQEPRGSSKPAAKKPDPKASATAVPVEGVGAPPRPSKPPASNEALQAFMRRILFSIPPTKLPVEAAKAAEAETGAQPQADEPKARRRAKPLPARKAKLALIESMRDLALEDRGFAGLAAALLREFMGSRGASERAACMVALARIGQAHADLKVMEDAA
jgi:hypothetical protein